MAIPDYVINVQFTDSKKKKSSISLYSNALTDAAARLNAEAMVDICKDLTNCRITSVELNINIFKQAGFPVNGSDVEEKVTFTAADTYDFKTQVSIPGFNEALILPNTDMADPDNAAVAAFIEAWIDGTYVSAHDDDLTTYVGSVKSWK